MSEVCGSHEVERVLIVAVVALVVAVGASSDASQAKRISQQDITALASEISALSNLQLTSPILTNPTVKGEMKTGDITIQDSKKLSFLGGKDTSDAYFTINATASATESILWMKSEALSPKQTAFYEQYGIVNAHNGVHIPVPVPGKTSSGKTTYAWVDVGKDIEELKAK